MAWVLPPTAIYGVLATPANWGDLVRDDLRYLKGLDGAVIIEDDLTVQGDTTVDNLITAGLVDGRDVGNDGALLDAHKARHEPAGADEINDIDIANTGVLLSAHAARHENAGADEISVAALSGLLADDQNPVEHGPAKHANRNRELPLIPFTSGNGVTGSRGLFATYTLTAAQEAHASFLIPVGFVSFVSAKIAILPTLTGTFDWTVGAEELAHGQVIGTDTDNDTANGQAGTTNMLLELDVSAAFDGLTLVVGDWVGVTFWLDALATITSIDLVGLKVTIEGDE